MGARLIFGEGRVSVTRGIQDGQHVLLLEDSGIPHEVGSLTGRQPGEKIPAEEVDKMIILEFSNKESLQVVIDALDDMKGEMDNK